MASDAELVARAAEGDPASVAALYDRYAPVLLGIGMRILHSRQEAEDALHDTFVSLPRRAKHYTTNRGSVIAWLATVVRNVSIDHVRRHRRGAHAEKQPVSERPRGDPERDALLASERERARRALAALPEAQRAALESAFFEGLTYSQIAERDGISLNTVKSRCARGMQALREALASASEAG